MGFRAFKKGLDADVEENTERELFLEVCGEDMTDRGRVGLSVGASAKDVSLREHCVVQPLSGQGAVTNSCHCRRDSV